MSLFDEYEGEVILGKDAVLPKYGDALFLGEDDKFLCYIGCFPRELELRFGDLLFFPLRIGGRHSYEKQANFVHKYIRVENGCFVLDDYVDTGNKRTQYFKKIEEVGIGMGSNCSNYSANAKRVDGSLELWQENKEITRLVFGLTAADVFYLSKACGKMRLLFKGQKSFYWPPRITRSKSRGRCDWTGAWIPAGFPFVTFAPPGTHYEVVSIYGLCKELQKMCEGRMNSELSKELLNNGVPEDTLEYIINMPDVQNFFKAKDYYMEV